MTNAASAAGPSWTDGEVGVLGCPMAIRMEPIRFRFVVAGVSVVGPVHGAGGMLRHAPRLDAAKRLASQGRPHGLYEPQPGHVAVFPSHAADGNGEPVFVPLSALVGVTARAAA